MCIRSRVSTILGLELCPQIATFLKKIILYFWLHWVFIVSAIDCQSLPRALGICLCGLLNPVLLKLLTPSEGSLGWSEALCAPETGGMRL